MELISRALFALAALLLIAVLVSLIPSDRWFIRTVDLVREPMSYVSAILLVAAIFLPSALRWVTIGALAFVIAINIWRIWPYVPLAETEVNLTGGGSEKNICITAMSVNVKVKNTDHGRLVSQLQEYDPDLLFLMETDQAWVRALEPVLARYPHVHRHPQPEAFGLVFASRIPVQKSNVVENTHRDTPTLYATLRPNGSEPIEFIGLHPKPPLPEWNTDLRDRNIISAAIQTPDRLPDAIVMGDFNDVPWSRTTSKFRELGDWRDPRVGRGTYPTFPSDYQFAGWPLDQVMVKGGLDLASFEVLDDNGSDHRALWAEFCPRTPG